MRKQRLYQDLRYARQQARLMRFGRDAAYWQRKANQIEMEIAELGYVE